MTSDRIKQYQSQKIDLFIEQVRATLGYQLDAPFSKNRAGERVALIDLCESPIEQLMLIALLYMEAPLYEVPPDIGWTRPRATDEQYEAGRFDRDWANGGVVIHPQHQIGSYRVDFLIVAKFTATGRHHKIVVECDGHDYHERTKEQAQRDKSPDRALQADGYQVFRFTGSEIWRDPDRCAKEIQDHLTNSEYQGRDDWERQELTKWREGWSK